MNLRSLSADELIKTASKIAEPSELEQALLMKLTEVKSGLDRVSELVETASYCATATSEK